MLITCHEIKIIIMIVGMINDTSVHIIEDNESRGIR